MPWVPLPPPPDDLVYLVMVDRFEDAAPNPGPVDLDDPHAWHGGDLAGVETRLDHLEALGVKTVWLTPIFASQQDPFHEWGAFHGYWVTDPTRLDPRFGDFDDLRSLSDALHARDMRLVLDVVYNHVGWESPIREQHPGWFHDERPIERWDDPVEVVEGTVHGLPDLAQEQEEVYAWLLDWSLALVEAGRPDGFRVDAVRHLHPDFLGRLSADLQETAPQLELLGEVYEGDPVAFAAAWEQARVDRLFDFPLHFALVDTMCGGSSPGRLAAMLAADRHYADPSALVTFLDNHDRPRILSACGDDVGKVGEALELLFALRGTPALTWGTEVPLAGAEEPENRADMRWDDHALDETIQVLAKWRAGSEAALYGATRIASLTDDELVIERRSEHQLLTITVKDGHVDTALTPASGPAPEQDLAWVTISAAADLASGETLKIVGSHEPLGSWSVDAAPSGPLRFQVPADSVLAFKLVRVAHDGTVTWEDREDRFLHIPATGVARVVRWGD